MKIQDLTWVQNIKTSRFHPPCQILKIQGLTLQLYIENSIFDLVKIPDLMLVPNIENSRFDPSVHIENSRFDLGVSIENSRFDLCYEKLLRDSIIRVYMLICSRRFVNI